MRLNGAHGHEQLARDLLVRAAAGDELGDAPLRLRQPVRACPPADACELAPRLRAPELRAELFEDRDRALDRVARGPLLPEAPQRLALREQRARELEAAVLHPRVLGERALEGRDGAG